MERVLVLESPLDFHCTSSGNFVFDEAICPKKGLIAKDDFSVESRVNFELFHISVREYTARSMVIWFQFLRQHNFVRMKPQVLLKNPPSCGQ